ncbi:MAG: TetR family transcriptional regulator [Pseudonocardia sp.]|nr:TetR family transcriptional regulator [Pseudonocardia sp.]
MSRPTSAREPDGQRIRRRGRRPAGQQTKEALVEAARAEFAERGFDQARVRSIATAAGVDPAMVNHWFGGKDGLFMAAMDLPIDLGEVLARILDGAPAHTGERIVRTFLSVWDPVSGGPFAALLRSVSSHEQAAMLVREFVAERLFGRLVATFDSDQPKLRAALCASQVVGLGMARYVIRVEPLASAKPETLVTAIGPTLQRYLTGDLS